MNSHLRLPCPKSKLGNLGVYLRVKKTASIGSSITTINYFALFSYSETTENYKCAICFNVFDSKELIKEHLKSSHENTEHNENDYELVNEAFNCELCGRYFSYKHHLQHHVER